MEDFESRITRLEAFEKLDQQQKLEIKQDVKALYAEVKRLNETLSRFRGVWLGIVLSASAVGYFISTALNYLKGKL